MEWTGRVPELIFKQLRGEISEDEAVELQDWVSRSERHRAFYDEFISEEQLCAQIVEFYAFRENVLEKISKEIPNVRPGVIRVFTKKTRAYAAAVIGLLFVVGGGAILMDRSLKKGTAEVKNAALGSGNVGTPGRSRAVLTLGDGSMIDVDSLRKGAMTREGNAEISKKDSAQLVYSPLSDGTDGITYNTLTTPRGGQYRLMLPDGSKVWLDAASSLRFPTSFTGKDRQVELTGQAYFEIVKDTRKPFRVKVNELTVDVIGTSFNIMAYGDEPSVKTSLIQGAVQVRQGSSVMTLFPGQQASATMKAGVELVRDADMEEAVAWKDGSFYFNKAGIEAVMRQIGRWYNVNVVYEGVKTVNSFTGVISRNTSLADVLKILELSGVRFHLDRDTVTVLPL
jgi:ferric-dicitrate binding protein FerR (iron transport regulator)